jgi:hypothetical protein
MWVNSTLKLIGVAVCVSILLVTPVLAESAISQGFNVADGQKLSNGLIVSLDDKATSVSKSSTENAKTMVGVVSDDSLLELTTDKKQTQVVTSGTVFVAVSEINGLIQAGDQITASPLEGVGMLATDEGYVVGIAQSSFSDAQNVTTQTVRSKASQDKQVKVGMIPVQIGVTQFKDSSKESSILPSFLTKLANEIAGKEVPVARVLAAALILLLGSVASAGLLFVSVRSSMISIGRNPLAAPAVHRGLFEVMFISLGVLLAMLCAVYLILVI